MEELKVVELTAQRKGEVTLAFFIRKTMKERFSLTRADVMKTVGRILQKIEGNGVTKDELLMLYQWIVSLAVKDSFGAGAPEVEPKIERKRAEEISLLIYEESNVLQELSFNQEDFREKIMLLAQLSSDDFTFSADEIFSLFREKVYRDVKKILG